MSEIKEPYRPSLLGTIATVVVCVFAIGFWVFVGAVLWPTIKSFFWPF